MAQAEKTRIIDAGEPPALAVQALRLVMVRGPEPGRAWTIGPRGLTAGKGPDNDAVLLDATVSRRHFTLAPDDRGLLLRDAGSTNGTFVGGARVVEAHVRPGAEIRAGEVLLRLEAVSRAVEIAPADQLGFGGVVGASPAMRRVFALLERVAPEEATVLIVGETGSGKGALARAIHARSRRAGGPFVTIDCGAISATLIESELFGHERGAFTGASQRRRGAMEEANGGTLFIDDLDDLPLDLQPRLLRALEEREVTRLGANRPIKLDIRVIAATKRDLRREVAEGRFREDLYYRLSVVTVPLPPLRERLEDLPLLADHFLGREGAWDELPRAFRRRLEGHHFPGNVRELRNLLERARYLDGFADLDPAALPVAVRAGAEGGGDFRLAVDFLLPFKEAKEDLVARFEAEYLRRLLARAGGKVARAAREAKIDRKYLYMLLEKHGMGRGR